jgi:hypothetical protein
LTLGRASTNSTVSVPSSCWSRLPKIVDFPRVVLIYLKIAIQIKFLYQDTNIWMTCPKNDVYVDGRDFLFDPEIHLKLENNIELIDTIMKDSADEIEHSSEEAIENRKCRRLKERKIKNVIEKVLKWRELYAGGSSGDEERIPLE